MVAAPRRGSISLSCCHSPPASLCAHSSGRRSTCSLTRRVTPDGSEQLARAPPPALCWPVFPPFFSFLSARRAGLSPPSPNKARSQPPCRQLLSGPGGSGLHGGASAASAVQQMQKREKSFGKMLTLRFGMYGGHVSCVFSVLCDGKLQRLCVEGDVSRSDPLLL